MSAPLTIDTRVYGEEMKEKGFQDLVIGLIEAKSGHATNVEPGITNPGMPDINFCLHGIEGNIELKYGYDGTIEGKAPEVRPGQVAWFRERVKAGGYPMFGYYIKSAEFTDEVYVFQGRYFLELAQAKTYDDLLEIPHLRVMNPNDFIEAVVSEMASWHDEVDPPANLVLPYG